MIKFQNYKILVSYDGSKFLGSQIQARGKTVAGEIAAAVRKTVAKSSALVFASRTDRGVHARGNVCSFKSQYAIPPDSLVRALNSRLTKYIRVTAAYKVPAEFNPRYDCVSKVYRYYFRSLGFMPFHADYCMKISPKADRRAMEAAAALIPGEKDFRFLSSCSARRNTVCKVAECFVSKGKNVFFMQIEGGHFLYKMVRTLASFVAGCGTGKFSPPDFKDIISGHAEHVPPALPGGLYLWKVKYQGNVALIIR